MAQNGFLNRGRREAGDGDDRGTPNDDSQHNHRQQQQHSGDSINGTSVRRSVQQVVDMQSSPQKRKRARRSVEDTGGSGGSVTAMASSVESDEAIFCLDEENDTFMEDVEHEQESNRDSPSTSTATTDERSRTQSPSNTSSLSGEEGTTASEAEETDVSNVDEDEGVLSSSPSSEGFLRAILNKVAPSEAMSRLAHQVTLHLHDDESAREQLALQLVERAQTEPLIVPTYAQLCTIVVRSRSGYIFYKHLIDNLRATFRAGIDDLVVKPQSLQRNNARMFSERFTNNNVAFHQPGNIQHQRLLQRFRNLSSTIYNNNDIIENSPIYNTRQSGPERNFFQNTSPPFNTQRQHQNPLFSEATHKRHRLGALCIFLAQLYLEDLLSRDQLFTDFLQALEGHLPHPVALECLCKTISRSGRRLEIDLGAWLDRLLRTLDVAYSSPPPLQQTPPAVYNHHANSNARLGGVSPSGQSPPTCGYERSLRLTFMVKDLLELRARNWQPRDAMARVRSLSEESEP